jgi:predicted AAA+ superfamily ATPase
LAARTGQLLSYSEVSRELGVAVNTVKRYLRFLEISYQAYLLRPLLPTVPARLVKSPKLYWTDPGLARLLSERTSLDDGPVFETYVLDEILRWLSWQSDPPHLYFYRTHGGREVDFVLYSPNFLLAIEAKASIQANRKDSRPLIDLLENVRTKEVRENASRLGLVVTRGREPRMLAPRVWAVPNCWLFGAPG